MNNPYVITTQLNLAYKPENQNNKTKNKNSVFDNIKR